MNVKELNRKELLELKQKIFLATQDNAPIYWSDLAYINEIISDKEVFKRYEGVSFTKEDFFCNM